MIIKVTSVPNGSVDVSLGPSIFERPKSTNLSSELSESSTIIMFSSFKSLCAIP
jgi:hypothetical protein